MRYACYPTYTCIVQGSVIVFWVREIMYTKCLITLCASIFQLYNLVAFESSTDVGLPIFNDVYYVSLIEFNQLYYNQNINEPVTSSTMNDLSL